MALPGHSSGASHTPFAARHSTVVAAKPSTGHAADVPLHCSAKSHTPADARHSTVVAANPSAGHVPCVPLHRSATSHTPAEGRHSAIVCENASVGHAAEVPVHCSATSQTPSDARHVTDAGANPSVGHVNATPSHASATSQLPAAARHDAPAAFGAHTPAPPQNPLPHASSEHSESGSVPGLTGAHTPAAPPVFSAEHAEQAPSQRASQHTPSVQNPSLHSESELHAFPFASGGGLQAQTNDRRRTSEDLKCMRQMPPGVKTDHSTHNGANSVPCPVTPSCEESSQRPEDHTNTTTCSTRTRSVNQVEPRWRRLELRPLGAGGRPPPRQPRWSSSPARSTAHGRERSRSG